MVLPYNLDVASPTHHKLLNKKPVPRHGLFLFWLFQRGPIDPPPGILRS